MSGLSITQIKKQKIYLKARKKSNILLCLFCSLGYYYSYISNRIEMIKLIINSKTSTAEGINDTIQRNVTYIKKCISFYVFQLDFTNSLEIHPQILGKFAMQNFLKGMDR